MADASEIELQFLLSEPEAARLRANPLLDGPMSQAVSKRLVSTYFDTSDDRLVKAGLFFRVRCVDGGFIQTLKQHGPTAFQRGEWEWPVATCEPDLALTADTPLKGFRGDLEPRFTVDVERTAALVSFKGAQIEVAFDCGTITGNTHRLPVCELELELKSGPTAGLFKLALELNREAALNLSFVSKGDRGHTISRGCWGLPVKAKAAPVLPAMSAAEAFGAIALSCLRQFAANSPAFAAGHGLEAVHQSRIAIRRIRAAFSLFAPILEDRQFSRFKRDVKWVARALGEARDLDVMQSEAIAPVLANGSSSEPVKSLARSVAALQRSAHQKLDEALRSKRMRMFLLEFTIWCETGSWRRDNTAAASIACGGFIAKRIAKWRESFARNEARFSELGDEQLHRLRIKAKKLRYMCEFSTELARVAGAEKRMLNFLAAIEKLQEAIGEMHDYDVRAAFLKAEAHKGGAADVLELQREIGDQFEPGPKKLAALKHKAARQAKKAVAVKSLFGDA